MADLKTDYKDDVLDTSVNSKRTFNIVDQDGNIIFENVTLNDTTAYSQIGDSFGALDINSTNEAIEQVSSDLETHTHDGRYYTEIEIDTKFKQVNSDLGKKLPLTGGELSGDIHITHSDKTESKVRVVNSLHDGNFTASVGGDFGVYDNTFAKWLIKSDKNGKVNIPSISVTPRFYGAVKSKSADKEQGVSVSVENGNYIAVINIEAWVGEDVNVQATCTGNDNIGTFMQSYQTGRNAFQLMSIANVTNKTFTLWINHNDAVERTINYEICLIKISD